LFGIFDRANSAGDAKRDIQRTRDARHPCALDGASLRACRNIIEHQFIRPFVAVACGELQNITDDAVVAKADAFDHLAVAYIEARNYAFGKNGCNSSSGIRFSSSALPLIAAAAPVLAKACKSRALRMPPEACHSMPG
jgi:hypothetical protein